ncbi:MAG: intradiol ring-cleavage dioxygenase [Flavobacteriaceae bacterium]|nr:MAG: intradiol ring-cleavage dioxygenase [Flavobacteriaceae bacterium]
MDRKKFLKNGLVGLGTIVALPTVLTSFSKNKEAIGDCDMSPRETAGPFPNISPATLAMQNIIGNRTGVPFLITLTIQDQSDNCKPLANVFVDIWHCDAKGYYSQYGKIPLQRADYTNESFLRGRQTTDENGQISFISIFPGWYPSRAPHIHVEVLDANENSLRITQIAFPEDVCDTVYATNDYKGKADTLNAGDGVFANSLDGNMLDNISGNTTDGYTLLKTIVV